MGGETEAQQLMISQNLEGWQGEGFSALGPQISPLSLSRGENTLTAELQTTHSAGAHFPPCWQLLSMKTPEAWARRESKKDSLCIQCVFHCLGSTGCLQGASTAAGDSPALQQTRGHCRLPANTSHEIQSSPGCCATAGPPGQLRGAFEGSLSTQ